MADIAKLNMKAFRHVIFPKELRWVNAVVEKLPVEVALQRIRGKSEERKGREGRERKDEREKATREKEGEGKGRGIAWVGEGREGRRGKKDRKKE